jgi:hypothetical protein
MTDSRVVLIFESADGAEQCSRYYDTDDYEGAVAGGEHDQIVDELMVWARSKLGPGAVFARTLVDCVEQPD